jgi:hypothetical protein
MRRDARRGRCAALAWFAALLSATPAAAGDALVVPRLSGAVALDGVLAEPQWRSAARLTHADFIRWVAVRYDADPDEFSLRLFHDGEALYVALASYDRYVEPDVVAESSDGLYSFSLITRAGELQHYRLRWSADPPAAGGQMLDPGRFGARLRGPFADGSRPGGGYVLEFAIPLKATGWRPGESGKVNIIVQDHDGKPRAPHDAAAVHYARFAWGGFDNDDRRAYRSLRLAP